MDRQLKAVLKPWKFCWFSFLPSQEQDPSQFSGFILFLVLFWKSKKWLDRLFWNVSFISRFHLKLTHWNTFKLITKEGAWTEENIALQDSQWRNVSTTRNRVSSGYPNTEKKVQNTMRSGVFSDEIQGVRIADETVLSVWYIFSIETKTKEYKTEK